MGVLGLVDDTRGCAAAPALLGALGVHASAPVTDVRHEQRELRSLLVPEVMCGPWQAVGTAGGLTPEPACPCNARISVFGLRVCLQTPGVRTEMIHASVFRLFLFCELLGSQKVVP